MNDYSKTEHLEKDVYVNVDGMNILVLVSFSSCAEVTAYDKGDRFTPESLEYNVIVDDIEIGDMFTENNADFIPTKEQKEIIENSVIKQVEDYAKYSVEYDFSD